eukprot:3490087-Amphidinium_carterae.2
MQQADLHLGTLLPGEATPLCRMSGLAHESFCTAFCTCSTPGSSLLHLSAWHVPHWLNAQGSTRALPRCLCPCEVGP